MGYVWNVFLQMPSDEQLFILEIDNIKNRRIVKELNIYNLINKLIIEIIRKIVF